MRITHELGLTSYKTADGTEYEADAEGYIDVPDEVAKGLLRQPGWKLAEAPAGESKAPEAPAPDPQGDAGTGGGGEPADVDLEALDREVLDALAVEHGVEVSPRWGDKRVRATLAAAGVGA